MSAKNALLIAAAVAVLVAGVYLFIQVRATPAEAGATQVTTAPSPSPSPSPAASPAPAVAAPAAKPDVPAPGSTRTSWERPASAGSDGAPPDNAKVNLKLDNLMELANKAYDGQDFDQATAIAGKVLEKEPNNIRMLRIMVSSHCIQGDSAVAQEHYNRLPQFDRDQMKVRCDRYGVVFKDPP